MLRRLSVRDFKSLRNVSVEFPRFTILVGSNGAGKSNLLEAVQALSLLGTAPTLNDALQAPFPVRGFAFEALPFDPGGFPAQLARETDTFVLEADLDTAGGPYRYRIEPRINYRTGELTVADEYLSRIGRAGLPANAPIIERTGSMLRVRRKGRPADPREATVGLNHSVLSDRRLSGGGYVWLDYARNELANWRTYHFEARQLMRQEQAPAAVDDVGVHGECLASFLYRLRGASPGHFDRICGRLRKVVPNVDGVSVDTDSARGTLRLCVQQGGVSCSSRVVSECTLRVLALCAVAVNPWSGTVVTLEEPENGVHPRRLRHLARLLLDLSAERQVIMTSQSPLFVRTLLAAEEASDVPEPVGVFDFRWEDGRTVVEPVDPSHGPFADQEFPKGHAEDGESLAPEGLLFGRSGISPSRRPATRRGGERGTRVNGSRKELTRQGRRAGVFGMWRERREDGLTYERRVRGEWG